MIHSTVDPRCIQCHVNHMALDEVNQNNRLVLSFVGRMLNDSGSKRQNCGKLNCTIVSLEHVQPRKPKVNVSGGGGGDNNLEARRKYGLMRPLSSAHSTTTHDLRRTRRLRSFLSTKLTHTHSLSVWRASSAFTLYQLRSQTNKLPRY